MPVASPLCRHFADCLPKNFHHTNESKQKFTYYYLKTTKVFQNLMTALKAKSFYRLKLFAPQKRHSKIVQRQQNARKHLAYKGSVLLILALNRNNILTKKNYSATTNDHHLSYSHCSQHRHLCFALHSSACYSLE